MLLYFYRRDSSIVEIIRFLKNKNNIINIIDYCVGRVVAETCINHFEQKLAQSSSFNINYDITF